MALFPAFIVKSPHPFFGIARLVIVDIRDQCPGNVTGLFSINYWGYCMLVAEGLDHIILGYNMKIAGLIFCQDSSILLINKVL